MSGNPSNEANTSSGSGTAVLMGPPPASAGAGGAAQIAAKVANDEGRRGRISMSGKVQPRVASAACRPGQCFDPKQVQRRCRGYPRSDEGPRAGGQGQEHLEGERCAPDGASRSRRSSTLRAVTRVLPATSTGSS
jgi:hypothetical protein